MKEISERHLGFYKEQYWYAEKFLENFLDLSTQKGKRVFEVGTAEGGVLKYFSGENHNCCGLELNDNRFGNSVILNQGQKINFFHGDITDLNSFACNEAESFDVIIMRDVIEHIANDQKEKALKNIYYLLKRKQKCFISFPPKYSPFAGHQQNLKSIFGRLPYVFLLPNFLYYKYLNLLNLSPDTIDNLLETKESRLSINNFEKMIARVGFRIVKKEFYFIRPCHEYRFNWNRLRLPFRNLLIVQEIFTTGAIYYLSK